MLLDSLDVTTTCPLLFIMSKKKMYGRCHFKVLLNCFDEKSAIGKLCAQEKKDILSSFQNVV